MQIAPLLHVGRGVTAIIGGGGKTTLMETLAGELSKKGKVIITTTTHIYLEADMAMKEAALSRLHPTKGSGKLRYRAPDDLMLFLKSL